MDDLALLAKQHGTDKLEHGYCPYYEHHLPQRDEEFSLLEIGIQTGTSLRMWRDWFAKAQIHGIDINPSSMFSEDRITTHLHDAASLETWDVDPGQFTVVVDDGSHRSSDILSAFGYIWPRLQPGSWYVIEDLETQWNKTYEGGITGSSVVIMLENFLRETLRSNSLSEFHAYTEITFLRKGGK